MTPLSFAAISVRSLDSSIAFYRDRIGFDLLHQGEAPAGLAPMLGVPPGTVMCTAWLAACGSPVGQIFLVQIEVPGRPLIRQPGDRTSRGLWNLNFYVEDIRVTARQLRQDGFELWSDPVEYALGPEAGRAIEVLFEAPDGVAINLVQPLGDASVFTGRIRAQIERAGLMPTGFSPVATTANCVRSMDDALAFYQGMFGGQVVLDEVLGRTETNRFLARPADARSRTVFLDGGHFLGKLSLNEPLNYAVAERLEAARPPAVGYFAQGFAVDNLEDALARTGALGGQPFTSAGRLSLSGGSAVPMALVQSPGPGALVWLVQKP